MPDIKSVADMADVIVNGYAFIRKDGRRFYKGPLPRDVYSLVTIQL